MDWPGERLTFAQLDAGRRRHSFLQSGLLRADHYVMNTMACRAVTQAALCAATASLDDEAAWPLLQVAGWLTTAADLVLEAGLRETVSSFA